MKQLPSEVKKLIREFASDRLLPTPTALLIKQLHFQYQNETERHGIYLPDRLMVTTMSPTRFLDGSYSTIVHDDYIRRYHLVDFRLATGVIMLAHSILQPMTTRT